MRWSADMNMGSRGGPGCGVPKRDERNAGTAQMINERLPFRAVRMKRDVYGVPMIESHAVMRRRLP